MSHLRDIKRIVLSSGLMVDVESSGPGPSRYALLSLGATVIKNPRLRFYVELIPDRDEFVPSAMETIGHDLDYFCQHGIEPQLALMRFHMWVAAQPLSRRPRFVAHNAAYDWMFYADYCVRYHLPNPFGYSAIDTASVYGSGIMTTPLPHHAGEDAYLQTLDLRRYYGMK